MFVLGLMLTALVMQRKERDDRSMMNILTHKGHQGVQSNTTGHAKVIASEAGLTKCLAFMGLSDSCPTPSSCPAVYDMRLLGKAWGFCCSLRGQRTGDADCQVFLQGCQKYYKNERGEFSGDELNVLFWGCDKYCFELDGYEIADWCPYRGNYSYVAIVVLAILLAALIVLVLVYWFSLRKRSN